MCKQIKKKWQDVKTVAKKREAQFTRESTKTDGGPPPSPVDEKIQLILDVVGVTAVAGVEGEIDT